MGGIRSYAWGKKGADWTKFGKWLVRFDDRFDIGGGARSTATTTPPWADDTSATTGIAGGTTYGILTWTPFTDPAGRAVIGQACNGPCAIYSIVEGQSPLLLRDTTGKLGNYNRLLTTGGGASGSAVRVGEGWFFLTQGPSYDSIALFRAELGVVRPVATYYRPSRRAAALDPPRLVRRAIGAGIGLLVASPRAPNEPSGTWFVLPVDPDTGALEEPVFLGRRDLQGAMPERCQRGQDGWLVETALEMVPSIDLGAAYAPLDGIEMKLRIDPGSVCAEAIGARIDGVLVTQAKLTGKPKDVDANKVPLAATERGTGIRWIAQCGPQTETPRPRPASPSPVEESDE